MPYLVDVDHSSMAVHLTRSDCEGFKKCCMCSSVNGTDGDMLWNGSEGDGDVRGACEEDEGTDCEDGDSDTEW
jgi:hypothetical protein